MNGVCFTHIVKVKHLPLEASAVWSPMVEALNTVMASENDLSKFKLKLGRKATEIKSRCGRRYFVGDTVGLLGAGCLRLYFVNKAGVSHTLCELQFVRVKAILQYDSCVSEFFDISERFEDE